MKLYRTRTPEAVTVSIQVGEHSATLSGRPFAERAIIEGLLWWALGRMIEDFTLGLMADAIPAGMLIEIDAEIHTGERLAQYVYTTPWNVRNNREMLQVIKTLRANLSKILPDSESGNGDRVQRWKMIDKFTELLKDRIKNFDDLSHGVVIEDEPIQKVA